MNGLGVVSVSVCTFVVSLIFIHFANLLCNSCFSDQMSRYAELVSGAVIILLGVTGLF
jgi:putative Mn2+ efflux pump MntP